MYSSYSFTTSALDGGCGQRHSLAAFTPGKGHAAPIVHEAWWAPELEKPVASVGDRTSIARSSSL